MLFRRQQDTSRFLLGGGSFLRAKGHQAQAAAGHTTAAMTLKHYVKGRQERSNTALPIATAYGLNPDGETDFGKS